MNRPRYSSSLKGPATEAQVRFLRELYWEAAAAGYGGRAVRWAEGGAEKALQSMLQVGGGGKSLASAAIAGMIAAKERGWTDAKKESE